MLKLTVTEPDKVVEILNLLKWFEWIDNKSCIWTCLVLHSNFLYSTIKSQLVFSFGAHLFRKILLMGGLWVVDGMNKWDEFKWDGYGGLKITII